MLSVITSYLVQTGSCALPQLGVFHIEHKPAVNDAVHKQMLPPEEEVFFTAGSNTLTMDLVRYAALKKNISENEAAIELNAFCKMWKEKIDQDEVLHFESFGTLFKDELGSVIFARENNYFHYKAVMAEKVLRQNAEHAVLVGDTQTTSSAMNEYYNMEVPVEKRSWHFWAWVLFVLAMFVLLYSFYNRRFSPSSVGNRIHFTVKTAEETHFEISK